MNLVLLHLNQLVIDRFVRLLDVVRQQMLWLLREMIRNAVSGVDALCYNMLRNVAGGDVSVRNIALAEALLDIFTEYRFVGWLCLIEESRVYKCFSRGWLDKFPILVATVVYTYLRLIEDHISPHLCILRQKEVTFTVSLLREKFGECLIIGRDLVRLLQNVARLPEFDALWKDMYNAPRTLCANFSGMPVC
jgi:integrator complex subunit 3